MNQDAYVRVTSVNKMDLMMGEVAKMKASIVSWTHQSTVKTYCFPFAESTFETNEMIPYIVYI